jgi:hypothetical protein
MLASQQDGSGIDWFCGFTRQGSDVQILSRLPENKKSGSELNTSFLIFSVHNPPLG